MSLDNLPSDLCVHILSRLPTKTLIRCTTLSSKYKSLIISPDFLQALITRNTNKSQFFLRFSFDDYKKNDKFVFEPQLDDHPLSGFAPPPLLTNDNANENVKSLLEQVGLEAPLNNRCNEMLNIVGSINGVICLSDDYWSYTNVYVLWNPSIRKWLELPRPLVIFSTHGPHTQACGFGFDPVTNDYKVVRVVQLEESCCYAEYKEPPLVEVYSLNSGCWKIMGPGLMYRIRGPVCTVRPPCYLNGIVHWIGDGLGPCTGDHAMVTFSVSSEVFGIIELPECLKFDDDLYDFSREKSRDCGSEYDRVRRDVVEYKGMLAVIKTESRTCCIWVMKEYSVVDSWTKMFDITFPVEMRRVWTNVFGNNGEIIMPLRWGEVEKPWTNDIGSAADFIMRLQWRDNPVDKVAFLDRTGNIERVVGHMTGKGYHISRYVESMVLFDAGKGAKANKGSPEESSN